MITKLEHAYKVWCCNKQTPWIYLQQVTDKWSIFNLVPMDCRIFTGQVVAARSVASQLKSPSDRYQEWSRNSSNSIGLLMKVSLLNTFTYPITIRWLTQKLMSAYLCVSPASWFRPLLQWKVDRLRWIFLAISTIKVITREPLTWIMWPIVLITRHRSFSSARECVPRSV